MNKLKNWGGRRAGSGRKRLHSQGVAHRKREEVHHRLPLHVNFKYRRPIRNKDSLRLLKRAILNSRKKGLRVIHYSLQHNHVHLILEATSNEVLERGMRSLTVTMGKGLKKGKIQLKRYHLHVLRGLRETKNAIHYVLFNEQKHSKSRMVRLNGYSSLIFCEDVNRLVRKAKFTLCMNRRMTENFLDSGRSYLVKKSFFDFYS